MRLSRTAIPGNILDRVLTVERRLDDLEGYASLPTVDQTGEGDITYIQVISEGDERFVMLDGSNQALWIPNPAGDVTQDISGNFNIANSAYEYKIADSTALAIRDNNVVIGTTTDLQDVKNVVVGVQAAENAVGSWTWRTVILGYRAAREGTAYDSVIIGAEAQSQSNAASEQDVIIGLGAAYDSSTKNCVIIGRDVLGTGSGAGGHNSTDDVIIGAQAAASGAYDAANNVLMGARAGNAITSASYGVIIGCDAGAALTTGDRDVFVGEQAGEFTSTGECDTFVGYLAGQGNTVQYYNTHIGAFAGAESAGTADVSVGAGAMAEISGDYDVIIGSTGTDAVHYSPNITVHNSVWVGYRIGWDIAGGATIQNAVAVGFEAGYSQGGDGGVYVGYQAGYNETLANRLYIENSDSVTPLIGGDFANNRVGVNRAIADLAHTFEVGGDALIYNIVVDTAVSYSGLKIEQKKTAGATGAGDDFFGLDTLTVMDQAGGTVRYLDGIVNEVQLIDGTVTSVDAWYSKGNLDGGSVAAVYGGRVELDIEAAVTISGDVYGHYIEVDNDAAPGGTTYALYLKETAGVDYGLYQDGSAPNVLGGNLLQADAKYIATDQISARDADGLKLYDDGGNGIFVKDGGFAGFGTDNPLYKIDLSGGEIRIGNSSTDVAGVLEARNRIGINSINFRTADNLLYLPFISLGFYSAYNAVVGNSGGFMNAALNGYGVSVNKDSVGTIIISGTGVYGWTASSPFNYLASNDTGLSRLAANKVAIGNGTSGDVTGTLIVGNIGINESTPLAQLHLQTSSAAVIGQVIQLSALPSANALEVRAAGTPGAVLADITPTGGAFFSDKITLVQTDGNEAVTSLNDGYMDYGATTAHRFNAPLTLADKTLLVTPAAGTFEFYDDRLYLTNVAIQMAIDRTSNAIVSTTTVANTAAETTIYTEAIAANTPKARNVLRLFCFGELSNATAADDVTIKIKIGTVTVETFHPAIGNVSSADWHIEAEITFRSVGAGGAVAFHGHTEIDGNDEAINTESVAVDTTAASDLTVTVTWDNAKVGNTISIFQGFTQHLN